MTAISAASATESDRHETANPFPDLPDSRGPNFGPRAPRPAIHRFPAPRFGDYSRTRFESRVAFGGPDEGEGTEEVTTPTRQFSLLEITSGLSEDSREADERAEVRRLRDLRGRVKRARAVVARTPGLAETLARDRQNAARFYARFGITEAMLRHGVTAEKIDKEGSNGLN